MNEQAAEPDSIEALSSAVNQLRSERDGLRQAMRHRAVIEQAKGMLVERLTISPDEAFSKLVELSSRSNVKVVELAAGLVARKLPGEAETPVYLTAPDNGEESGSQPVSAPPLSVDSDVGTVRARLQLLTAQVSAAESFDDITHAIATATDCWPEPVNVILLVPEADGALRLVGSAGLSTTARSQWDRVPPIEDLPIFSALTNRATVLLTDSGAISRQFPVVADRPHEALAAMPLIHDDRVVGVLEVTWGQALADGDTVLSRLHSITDTCARRCEKLSAAPEPAESDDAVAEPAVLALFMEALSQPAALLSPMWSGDQIVDFQIDAASPAARRAARSERANRSGGTVLTTLPEVGSRLLLPALTQVVHSGEPQRLSDVFVDAGHEGTKHDYRVDLQAGRLWDRVLLTWRVASAAEQLWDQLRLTEHVTRCGSIGYDTTTGNGRWSPGAFALLGFDPQEAPPDAADLAGYAHAEDLADLRDRAATATTGDTVTARVRGAGDFAGREFEVTLCTDPAQPHVITAVLRDARATGSGAPERQRVAAAAARARLTEAEDRISRLTATASADTVEGVSFQAAHVGNGDAVTPCWYDAVRVSEAAILLIVGEVATGPVEATTQRLRHAAVAHAVIGTPPEDILTNLNTLCCHSDSTATAAVSVARLDVKENLLHWAAAGRNAPIVVDAAGKARLRSGALSLAVGASPGIEYQANRVELEPANRLLLYSESLLTTPDITLPRTLAALMSAAECPDIHRAATGLTDDLPGLADHPLCLVSATLTG